jgi:hypothetical protein
VYSNRQTCFFVLRPFIIGKKPKMIFYEAGMIHYLPIDKTNKMKAAKKLPE